MKKILLLMSLVISLIGCHQEENKLLEDLGYEQNDILLIINADDMGVHPYQTDATMDLLSRDHISSTSIMVPTPDFQRASDLLIKSGFQAGLHLTLTNEWQANYGWSATDTTLSSLHNKLGYLWANNQLLYENASLEDVSKEMKHQIEMAYEAGLDLSHIDAHMYAYMLQADYLLEIIRLAIDYRLPVLVTNQNKSEMNHDLVYKLEHDLRLIIPDTYTSLYMGVEGHIIKREYNNYIKSLKPGVHVLAIYPSYNEDGLDQLIKDIRLRQNDYDYWSSDAVISLLDEENVKVIDFDEIKALQRIYWTDDFIQSIADELH